MSGLKVSIKMSETELFKDLVAIVKDAIDDDRIPTDVRNEMESRIKTIIESKGKEGP